MFERTAALPASSSPPPSNVEGGANSCKIGPTYKIQHQLAKDVHTANRPIYSEIANQVSAWGPFIMDLGVKGSIMNLDFNHDCRFL